MEGVIGITGKHTSGTGSPSASLWFLFIITFAGNIMGGAVSTLMAVYLPVVVGDLLGKNDAGFLNQVSAYISSLYILGWTAGGFLWGMFSDRIGRYRSFLIALVMFGVFTLLVSSVNAWETVVVLRFLSGFCVGGVLVISNIYLTEIWPVKTRALFIGFQSIGFPIGIISAGLTNYLFSSWRTGFMIGIIPVGLSLISLVVIRDIKKADSLESVPAQGINLKQLFNENHSDLFRGSILFGSMLIGMWAVFSWIPTWIQSILVSGNGQKERGICMILLGIGGLSGGFFSGWISRALGLRKSMLLCFSGCLVLAYTMFGLNKTFSGIIYIETALLAVFFGISQGLLSTYIPQLFPSAIRGTATGICYNTGRILTAAGVFFVATMVTIFGGYSNALLAFSLVFLVGLITVFFSKELKIKYS